MFVLFGLKMKTLNIFSNHLLYIANFSIFYRVHINVLDSVRNLNAGHCNNSPSSFVFARQRGLKGRVSGQFMIRSITRHCESRVQVVYNQLINVLLNLFILVWTSKSIFMSRYLGDKSAFYIVPTSGYLVLLPGARNIGNWGLIASLKIERKYALKISWQECH